MAIINLLKDASFTSHIGINRVALIALILVASVTGFLIGYVYYSSGISSTPPAMNVALSSNPVCWVDTGNCTFVLDNYGKQCQITNISLYLHGDTTAAQTIIDIPSGLITTERFGSALLAHHNQTEIVSLPNTLQQGSVIYYQIYINNGGATIFGAVTIS